MKITNSKIKMVNKISLETMSKKIAIALTKQDCQYCGK